MSPTKIPSLSLNRHQSAAGLRVEMKKRAEPMAQVIQTSAEIELAIMTAGCLRQAEQLD